MNGWGIRSVIGLALATLAVGCQEDDGDGGADAAMDASTGAGGGGGVPGQGGEPGMGGTPGAGGEPGMGGTPGTGGEPGVGGEPGGTTCGGRAGPTCAPTEFCDFAEDFCDWDDSSGVCRTIPETCPDISMPVCGCDGQTYGNQCEAQAQGTDAAYPGPCEVPECTADECGPPPPLPLRMCDDGTVIQPMCARGPDGGCGWSVGECPPPPEVCGLPIDGGPCEAAIPRFAFDATRGQCVPFTYGGCGGNGNNFETLEDCQRVCGGAVIDVQCGGRAGDTCAADQFCDFERSGCDFADAQGVCRDRPEVCPEFFAPVCACDGQTYDNECFAHGAGVDVNQPRACGAPECTEDECGPGPPGPEVVCDDGTTVGIACGRLPDGTCGWFFPECPPPAGVCEQPIVAGDCDGAFQRFAFDGAQGGCVPFVYGGCGGNDNNFETLEACQMACGEPPVEVACGGRAGDTCRDDQFCDFAFAGCDFADAQGVCRARPEVCPAVSDPVCACNGQTYDNGCVAQAAGVDVNRAGACEGPVNLCAQPLEPGDCDADIRRWGFDPERGECVEFSWGGCGGNTNNFETPEDCAAHCGPDIDRFCGGRAGDTCGDGEFCDFANLGCDWADASGQCQARPEVCALVSDPVCGCDGRTYDNACLAQAAGTDAASLGPCEGPVDACGLPIEVGPCDAAIPRWAFDGAQGRCVDFTYGGCQGNANDFETFDACQAACGGGPATCGEPSRDFVVLGGGVSFGECLGGCVSTLTLGPAPFDDAAACDFVTLRVCDNGPEAACTTHAGVLTPAGHRQARTIAQDLDGVALEARYGCPDCADGGASTVELQRGDVQSSHVYETGRPPAVLAPADAFVQRLIGSLRTCATTHLVSPSADCAPRP